MRKERMNNNESSPYTTVGWKCSFTHSFVFMQVSAILYNVKCAGKSFLFRENVIFLFTLKYIIICNPTVPSSIKLSYLVSDTIIDFTHSQE